MFSCSSWYGVIGICILGVSTWNHDITSKSVFIISTIIKLFIVNFKSWSHKMYLEHINIENAKHFFVLPDTLEVAHNHHIRK